MTWHHTSPHPHYSHVERRHYDAGTYLDQTRSFGFYVGGAALCPDGQVRTLNRISATADTFFSIPAAVQVRYQGTRYNVAGYVTFTEDWVNDPDDPLGGHQFSTVEFRPISDRKHSNLFRDMAANAPHLPLLKSS